jgi:hypothetical protein
MQSTIDLTPTQAHALLASDALRAELTDALAKK